MVEEKVDACGGGWLGEALMALGSTKGSTLLSAGIMKPATTGLTLERMEEDSLRPLVRLRAFTASWSTTAGLTLAPLMATTRAFRPGAHLVRGVTIARRLG
jgi:hypothetical protein